MIIRRQPATHGVWGIAIGLAWMLVVVPTAMAVDPSPTPVPGPVATVTLVAATPNPVTFGSSVTLTATVTPNPAGGTITWTDTLVAGTAIGVSPVDAGTGIATITVTLEPGPHGIQAAFGASPGFAPSSSTPLFVPVVSGGTPTVTTLAASTPAVEEHAPVTLTATVAPPFEGIMLFVDGAAVLGNGSIDPDTGTASLKVGLVGVGDHQLMGMAFGDSVNAGSLSAPVTVTVTPDVQVLAFGIGLSAATFYPYKDGYRDTVEARGARAEPATVAISVYAPTGKRVRTAKVTLGSGPYSWAWNGRNASGTLLPAGRYRVVQVLTDTRRHTLSSTKYVALSSKRLVWKTASITRNGDTFNYWNASSFANVSLVYSKYTHGVYLYGNIYDELAWVEYDFKLPSAVKYGKLTWAVLGAHPYWSVNNGPAVISMWNFAADEEDAGAYTGLRYAWYSTRASGPDFVKNGRVRAFVSVYGYDEGSWDVEKVKLTYSFAVLQ
jgi:hypothetical protein